MRDDSTISSEFQISVASAQVFHLYFLFPYFSRVVENTWKIDCTLKLVETMLAVWTLFSRQSMTGFIVNCLIKSNSIKTDMEEFTLVTMCAATCSTTLLWVGLTEHCFIDWLIKCRTTRHSIRRMTKMCWRQSGLGFWRLIWTCKKRQNNGHQPAQVLVILCSIIISNTKLFRFSLYRWDNSNVRLHSERQTLHRVWLWQNLFKMNKFGLKQTCWRFGDYSSEFPGGRNWM